MIDSMKLDLLRRGNSDFYIREDLSICFDSNKKECDESMKPIDDMFIKFTYDINEKYRNSKIEIDKLCEHYIGTIIRKPS
jgi:hypothetical protein